MTQPAGIGFVDLSSNQDPKHTDWKAIRASGVRYAYIRACEGITPDAAYEAHRDAATDAGVMVGGYIYWRARHSWRENLDVFYDQIGNNWDLRPCIDLESDDKADLLTPEDLEYHVASAMADISLRNWNPILYTGPGFVASHLPADHRLGQYPLWYADYRATPALPRGWAKALARQWTGTGRVPGYPGNCDQSVWLCTQAELDAMIAGVTG